MSSFGKIFKITTFGEENSNSFGVIIDGCPSKLKICLQDISKYLERYNVKGYINILSGVEFGETLGTPITITILNSPTDDKFRVQQSYDNVTYHKKFGTHATGLGRCSSRENLSRLIAGAIAEKWLKSNTKINVLGWVSSVGMIECNLKMEDMNKLTREIIYRRNIKCPNRSKASKMFFLVCDIETRRDSVGGVITCICKNIPIGLGEPVFDKLESLLAHGMMSISGVNGFEIGFGFRGNHLIGSKHNNLLSKDGTNDGIQAGISNGKNISFRVSFKPPKITKINYKGFVLNEMIPVVESMANLVFMDLLLLQRHRKY